MEKMFCELKLDEVQAVVGGTIDSLAVNAQPPVDPTPSNYPPTSTSSMPMPRVPSHRR